MPCRHAGGTEPCKRGATRTCLYKNRTYMRSMYKSSAIPSNRAGDSGYAAELIVRTDLLLRGLEVTVPENRTCADDVHFRSASGWVSIQVKVAAVHARTGVWSCYRRGRPVTSDLLAWVDLRSKTIRYRNNAAEVPAELLA